MGNLIHRGKGSFTHVENTIFYEDGLSAKAKGVYCQIRSFESNPSWTFSISGLTSLFKDGPAAINGALKELEAYGFLIRARLRGEDGRYLSADNSLWVTLDDPSEYDDEVAELVSRGYTIVSKREVVKAPADASGDVDDAKPQVASTSRFSRCGKSTSGKTTSGKSKTINYLCNQQLIESNPSLVPPDDPSGEEGKGKGDFGQFDKGGFPEPFERLCEMSIKPVSSLKFKRDALAAWNRRLAEGYGERQILDAYDAYAESYRKRNGDDAHLAKNLVRWLEADGGLADFSDRPFPPELLAMPGDPLSMEEFAEADREFGKLWQKVITQRDVHRSWLCTEGRQPDESEVRSSCEQDAYYKRLIAEAEKRYALYLRALEGFRERARAAS